MQTRYACATLEKLLRLFKCHDFAKGDDEARARAVMTSLPIARYLEDYVNLISYIHGHNYILVAKCDN